MKNGISDNLDLLPLAPETKETLRMRGVGRRVAVCESHTCAILVYSDTDGERSKRRAAVAFCKVRPRARERVGGLNAREQIRRGCVACESQRDAVCHDP